MAAPAPVYAAPAPLPVAAPAPVALAAPAPLALPAPAPLALPAPALYGAPVFGPTGYGFSIINQHLAPLPVAY